MDTDCAEVKGRTVDGLGTQEGIGAGRELDDFEAVAVQRGGLVADAEIGCGVAVRLDLACPAIEAIGANGIPWAELQAKAGVPKERTDGEDEKDGKDQEDLMEGFHRVTAWT